jgi:hypothetical protein
LALLREGRHTGHYTAWRDSLVNMWS